MINNVKSVYFVRLLFFHFNDGKKLQIVRNNKTLQKILNLNIIDYKLLSGKYIILDKEKSREYKFFNDEIIFEGEYKDGVWNGKGKEFDNNCLRFEGEYLNGKRNEKGKEYINVY